MNAESLNQEILTEEMMTDIIMTDNPEIILEGILFEKEDFTEEIVDTLQEEGC